MKLDLHIHTIYSDGCCTPEQIASRIKALGLHGFAITDHNSIAGWKRGAEAAKKLGLFFVPGNEIRIRNKTKKYGEILALFIQEPIKIPQQLENLGKIIDWIHDQDGIAAIPHPTGDTMRIQNITKYIKDHKIKIDAIEAINGRCDAIQNAKSIEYAIKERVGQIGGSDAHYIKEIGSVYTFAEAYSLEEFRKAIKKGLTKPIGIQKTYNEINYNRLLTELQRTLNIFKIKKEKDDN